MALDNSEPAKSGTTPKIIHMPCGGAVCFFIIFWIILGIPLIILQILALPFKFLQVLFCCNKAKPLKIEVDVTECA